MFKLILYYTLMESFFIFVLYVLLNQKKDKKE